MVKSKSSETKENTYLFCWIYLSLVMFVKDHSTAKNVAIIIFQHVKLG